MKSVLSFRMIILASLWKQNWRKYRKAAGRELGGYCNDSGVNGCRLELCQRWCRMGWTRLFLVRSRSLGPTAPRNCCCVSGLLTPLSPILSGHLGHMEVERLKVVKSELQLPPHATTILDASRIQDLPYSLIIATTDNYPTEKGQPLNLHPHGHYFTFLTYWAGTGTKEFFFWTFTKNMKRNYLPSAKYT